MIDLKEIKNKILKKENFYFLLIISAIFFLDRYSKIIVMKDFSDKSVYINNFLNFDLVWNTGIGFGLFSSNSSIVYNSISAIIALVIIGLLIFAFKADKFDKIIFALIIGGAVGNFYDRVLLNAVPDFIDVHFKEFHWFTFNLADIFITIGIICFIIKDLLVKN